ncbi:unnamed protein product [Cochlearia groenlandica]
MKKEVNISFLGFVLVLFLISRVNGRTHGVIGITQNQEVGFDDNYVVTWGQSNFIKLNQGLEVQLNMDNYSGSILNFYLIIKLIHYFIDHSICEIYIHIYNITGSGFESKNHYNSGFFQMRIKLPIKDTAGIVTAFYLTSKDNTHDEIDFEFLGDREGKPIILQTNVFTNGQGNREQKTIMWFDPSKDFHTYGLLWNPYQIVFYVDKIPIRVFKNITSNGINYPSKPMQVVVSLWNGEDWATDGGKAKINWANAPFKANFQDFNISGCSGDANVCGSSSYWWNTPSYSKLSDSEHKELKNIRDKYTKYDYCTDKARFKVPPSECKENQ